MNHFERLPIELIKKIFNYTESYIPFLCLTCKQFNSIIKNDFYLKKFIRVNLSILYNNDKLLIWCNQFYYNNNIILDISCQSSSIKTLNIICPNKIFNNNHLIYSLKNNDLDVFKFISSIVINQNIKNLDVHHFKNVRNLLSNNEFYILIQNCFYGNHNIYILDIIYVYINSIIDIDLWLNDIEIFLCAISNITPITKKQEDIYPNFILWIMDMIDKNQYIKDRWMTIINSKNNYKYSMLIYDPILLSMCKNGNLKVLTIIFNENLIIKGYNEILSKINDIDLINKSIINLIKTASYYGYVDILELLDQNIPIVKDIYAFYIILKEACHLSNENIDDNIIHVPILQWLYLHNNYNQYFNSYNLEIVIVKANKYNNLELNNWFNKIF